ncbi:hypothetical protein CKA55_03905 [Arcobacter suis]|uniref:Uncharacterized protein n=1 Tax=Arcobacter suis CECT 7833 TaxID=663365 RepID=A0AAD0SQW5_9BACT|nr:hypothetical protein [Arcobacter suis]AXX90009.1 hypothetical protein ASUIS_1529 [Arcobacter suis CECT 7833]RWS47142.1 hypothetical protein CKA55_03905 [Arcobacter suis]
MMNYTIEELIKKNEISRNEILKVENRILKAENSKLFDQNLYLSSALADMAELARKAVGLDEDEIELLTETIENNLKHQTQSRA